MPPQCDRRRQPIILLVDDDQDNLDLLSYQVSMLTSCSLLSESSGERALFTAKQAEPDLILLDIMLPDLDGFQIVHRLKEDPQTSHIPVIAVTAMARAQDQESALEAGYDDYLTKPYELEHLESMINRYLSTICFLPH